MNILLPSYVLSKFYDVVNKHCKYIFFKLQKEYVIQKYLNLLTIICSISKKFNAIIYHLMVKNYKIDSSQYIQVFLYNIYTIPFAT